jgi:hypothetical protein
MNHQIPAEMIQAGCNILRFQIHKLINSILNKEEKSHPTRPLVVVPGSSRLAWLTKSSGALS